MKAAAIKTLFLDIGNVLLTNGWGHDSLYIAIDKFGLDKLETVNRHEPVFFNYEIGKLTLDDYLNQVIFHQPRAFTREAFKAFILEQSRQLDGHVEYFTALKKQYSLKVFAVNNEGRELNEYRIKTFHLDRLFDGYVSSCYTGLHKPSNDLLQMACDISHTKPAHGLYVDDREALVTVAADFGLHTLHFTGLDQAKTFMETCVF